MPNAEKAGKQLNNRRCPRRSRRTGDRQPAHRGQWASPHQGKYDANDTCGLVAFDGERVSTGDWKSPTPVADVSGP
jgi:hypothetical protein